MLSMNGIDILSWLDTWLAASRGEAIAVRPGHRTTCRRWRCHGQMKRGAAAPRPTHGAPAMRRQRSSAVITAATSPPGKWRCCDRADRTLAAAVEPPYAVEGVLPVCTSAGSSPTAPVKDMMARVAMLAMHRDGLIALPAPIWDGRTGPGFDRLRAGHRSCRCSPARDDLRQTRIRPLENAPRRARHPPEQALERVSSPAIHYLRIQLTSSSAPRIRRLHSSIDQDSTGR